MTLPSIVGSNPTSTGMMIAILVALWATPHVLSWGGSCCCHYWVNRIRLHRLLLLLEWLPWPPLESFPYFILVFPIFGRSSFWTIAPRRISWLVRLKVSRLELSNVDGLEEVTNPGTSCVSSQRYLSIFWYFGVTILGKRMVRSMKWLVQVAMPTSLIIIFHSSCSNFCISSWGQYSLIMSCLSSFRTWHSLC